MTSAEHCDQTTDVAIIGMAGRFPGASTLDQFWINLRDGVESVKAFSQDELRHAGVAPQVVADISSVKAGGVLEDAECFDAEFFGISPSEAELMDPQQRVFVECVWSALENAGYGDRSGPQDVGVFAGTSMSTYLLNALLHRRNSDLISLDPRMLIGNDKDYLTTRVSYFLNLTGPAVTVQSACSTSLVAVHLAAQSVLNGECAMALAGGVSIGIPQVPSSRFLKGGIKSRDGHCRAFDVRADGIVGGSGVGVVLLKGLTEALADGDHIHAVIKGSAVNNDGRAKVGYTAPSQRGQTSVVRSAMGVAGVEPRTIGYIEAHGTGTALGDQIEIAALAQAYAGVASGPCLIGTVKSNVGHLDAAAGIAGLIKTVLCLQHGLIVPSLHVDTPNPALNLDATPFRISSDLRSWPRIGNARRAGVSSFAIGGTNAHVILEEALAREGIGADGEGPQLVVLSARRDEALETLASSLADDLDGAADISLGDFAFTLQRGRTAMNRRRAIVCESTAEATSGLRARSWLGGGEVRDNLPLVYLFPGQGADLLRAGERLQRRYPHFAATIDDCANILLPLCGFDVRAALGGAAVGPNNEFGLGDTIVAQPALFALEYALARLWMEWGPSPVAMIGHSLGEFVAACVSGVLTLEGALAAVVERGRAMQDIPAGAMLVVALEEADLMTVLAETAIDVHLAAVNGPRNCVVSGTPDAIAAFRELLSERRIASQPLRASRAFHSPMMKAVAERVGRMIEAQRPGTPQIPYVSTLTGDWASTRLVETAQYWASQTLQPVRFYQGLQTLGAIGAAGYLEVGPGDELTRLAKSSGSNSALVNAATLARPGGSDEERSILTAVGVLWSHGVRIRWAAMPTASQPHRRPLATYPFERRRWSAPQLDAAPSPSPTRDEHRDIASWLYAPGWRAVAGPGRPRTADSPCCVVFHDAATPADHLIHNLKMLGAKVIEVRPDAGSSDSDQHAFTIDPHNASDYAKVLTAVSQLEQIPLRLVQCVSPEEYRGVHAIGKSVGLLQPICHLARAITLKIPSEWPDVRLYCVTTGGQAVGAEVAAQPLHALAAGSIRSIARELPNVRCACIDIDTPAVYATADTLAKTIVNGVDQPLVAIRGERTFVPSMDRLRWTGEPTIPAILRESGVYVVTGGVGGVGRTLANYLARIVRARLVLVSRRGEDSLSPAQRQRIAEIKAVGGEVLILRGDVASLSDMERVRKVATVRFGHLNGIVHAAGVAAAGMIVSRQDAQIRSACTPKVDGTFILSQAFRGEPLDFVMLCSSLVSVLGAPAQAAFASANSFLDVIPYTELFPGAVVQTINWDRWQDIGMAVDVNMPAKLEHARQESLRHGITPGEGTRIFEFALASGDPQLIVSTRDLFVPLQPGVNHTPPGPDVRGSATSARTEERDIATVEALEGSLCRLWADALRLSTVKPDDNVFDLGADSLLALHVVATIEHVLGCELSPVICYEAPTARLLAQLITDRNRTTESSLRNVPKLPARNDFSDDFSSVLETRWMRDR